MKKPIILFLATGLILASCSSNDSSDIAVTPGTDKPIVSTLAADPLSPEEAKKMDEEAAKRKAEYESTLTTMEFDKLTHDFGQVGRVSENSTVFTVTNTGKVPLLISDVSASCGCTTPQKPDGPIAPGESDVIEVTFKPKESQAGQPIDKNVVITANTKEKLHKVNITAQVDN